jgi:hypothetical protein
VPRSNTTLSPAVTGLREDVRKALGDDHAGNFPPEPGKTDADLGADEAGSTGNEKVFHEFLIHIA